MQIIYTQDDVTIREVPSTPVAILEHRGDRATLGTTIERFITWRKTAGLSPVAIALLREAGPPAPDAGALAHAIKNLRLRLETVAPITRAISSAGGVAWREVDDDLMLRRLPGVFVAGEMLDWEAPTGGYLLQACFATGACVGSGALQWLARSFPSAATEEEAIPPPP